MPSLLVSSTCLIRRLSGAIVAALAFGVAGFADAAEPPATLAIDIPAADAATALKQFSAQSGLQVLYSNDEISGVRTNAVQGRFTAADALDRLLAGTPLTATPDTRGGAVAVARQLPNAPRVAALARADRPANPERAGSIAGLVSNAATSAYLTGAQVSLQPGNVTVLTERDGRFAFGNVAPGNYTLSVEYAGLDGASVPVRVTGGNETQVGEITLSAGIYQLAAYVTEGEREGNALAIQQQKVSPNLRNTIAADAFGSVSDLNIGNFLMRLPGFSPEVSEGQIIRVQIRGTSSNLNAFSVDGTRLANGTTTTFNRSQDIDRVTADFIETIDVTKAATPDIDADSIGGAVNMKSKSAFDRKGRRFNYNLGMNYNTRGETFKPVASAAFSDVFLGGKLGVLVTTSYSQADKSRDQNLMGWQNSLDLSKPSYFYARGTGYDGLTHKRSGISGRIDYRFTPDVRVYLNLSHTVYEDTLDRYWVRQLDPGAANVVSVSADETVTVARATFDWLQTRRFRDVKTSSFTLGTEVKQIWGGKLDANASFSPSRGTEQSLNPTRRQSGTVSGVNYAPVMRAERVGDRSGIVLTQVSGPSIYDWHNSTLASLDWADKRSNDEILGAQINYEKPVAWRLPVTFKTGLRYRGEMRDRDQLLDRYNYVGANGAAGPVGPTNDDDLGRFALPNYTYYSTGSGYPPYSAVAPLQFLDYDKLNASRTNEPQYWRKVYADSVRDTLRYDNKVTEDVSAGYLQANVRLGRLNLLGGVRLENTHLTASGFKQEITAEEKVRRAAWVGTVTDAETIRRTLAEYDHPVTVTKSYTNVFPSVHLKYGFTRSLIARASYSTGIGRPNFATLVPAVTVDNDARTISASNPGIRPQFSDNYDASLEYYFRPAGAVSVAVFEKRLRDFIYRLRGADLGADNEYGPEYAGYAVTIDQNGGKAKVRGLEVAYQQDLVMLPGRWRGFGLFANATFLKTEGEYSAPGVVTQNYELANFTPVMINAGVSYNLQPWSVRLLMNRTGRRLVGTNSSSSLREITRPATIIDLKLAYALNRHVKLWCDVDDVFSVGRQDSYYWNPAHDAAAAVYVPIIKVGVSGSF